MRRVFRVDIQTCAQCQGRLRVVARVDNPDAVQAMLRHLHLPECGMLEDPQPDREPPLKLAYDSGA